MSAARNGGFEFRYCRSSEQVIVSAGMPLAHSILLQLSRRKARSTVRGTTCDRTKSSTSLATDHSSLAIDHSSLAPHRQPKIGFVLLLNPASVRPKPQSANG